MKFAWIENSKVRDVCPGNPVELYHEDVAALYITQVPDDAVIGDGWVNNKLIKQAAPPAPIPPAPEAPKVSPVQFKLLFAPGERVAMDAAKATDPILKDFFSIVDDPRLTFVDLGLQSTKDAVGYLVSKSLITAERAAEILAGVLK